MEAERVRFMSLVWVLWDGFSIITIKPNFIIHCSQLCLPFLEANFWYRPRRNLVQNSIIKLTIHQNSSFNILDFAGCWIAQNLAVSQHSTDCLSNKKSQRIGWFSWWKHSQQECIQLDAYRWLFTVQERGLSGGGGAVQERSLSGGLCPGGLCRGDPSTGDRQTPADGKNVLWTTLQTQRQTS